MKMIDGNETKVTAEALAERQRVVEERRFQVFNLFIYLFLFVGLLIV